MNMKKTIASTVAGIVAISAMATTAFAAETRISVLDSAKTYVTATFDALTVPAATYSTDTDITLTVAEDAELEGSEIGFMTNLAADSSAKIFAKVTAKDTNNAWATDVTKEVAATVSTNDVTIDADDMQGTDAFGAGADWEISKIELVMTAVKGTNYDNANIKSIKMTAPTSVDAKLSSTTYADAVKADFALYANESSEAAKNGLKIELAFAATTADKIELAVSTSQSREEYKVEVAKGATTATIEVPAKAFAAGQANTIDLSGITGIDTITKADVVLGAAPVVEPETDEDADTDTDTDTDTDDDKNPPTGSAPIALALIPAALAAAVVVAKRK